MSVDGQPMGFDALPPLVKAASDFFATIPMEPPVQLAPGVTIAHGELPNSPAIVRKAVLDLPDVYASTVSVMQQNWDSVVVQMGETKFTYLGPCRPTDAEDGAADANDWSPTETRRGASDGAETTSRTVAMSSFYREQADLAVTSGGGPSDLPDFPSWVPPLECDFHESEIFFLIEEPLPIPGATMRDFAGRCHAALQAVAGAGG